MKLSREQKRQLAEATRQLMEAAKSDPNPEYGCKIVWHEFLRGRRFVNVSGTDRAAVKAEALRCAKNSGWTPPKWWQWWRWTDTRIDEA